MEKHSQILYSSTKSSELEDAWRSTTDKRKFSTRSNGKKSFFLPAGKENGYKLTRQAAKISLY